MFHRYVDEQEQESGSFETFTDSVDGEQALGWYWWPCFPGCPPDGKRFGPFANEQDAVDDALPHGCYVDVES